MACFKFSDWEVSAASKAYLNTSLIHLTYYLLRIFEMFPTLFQLRVLLDFAPKSEKRDLQRLNTRHVSGNSEVL